jgi:hypothetical protein
MRINVPLHVLKCKDPRSKYLKELKYARTLSAMASQGGNSITIRVEGFEMALTPEDALKFVDVIKAAIDDNATIPHVHEAIW